MDLSNSAHSCESEDEQSRVKVSTPKPVSSEDVDSDTSEERFAGRAPATEGVEPSSLQDEMPMVGRSGSTGVKGEILSTTPPKDVPVVPQTPEPSATQATPKDDGEENSLEEGDGASPTEQTRERMSPDSKEPGFKPVQEEAKDRGKITVETEPQIVSEQGTSGIEERLKKLEVKGEALEVEVKEVREESREVRAELHEHKQQHKESQKKLQNEIDALKEEVVQLRKDKENYRQQLVKKSEELDKKSEELKQERKEKVELQSKLDEREKRLAQKESEIQKKENEMKKLKAKYEKLEADLEVQRSHNYEQHMALKDSHATTGAALGRLTLEGQAHSPPPPYDDHMGPAPSSVEASLDVDGSASAQTVQGPVSRDQPPLETRLPNLTGAPEDGAPPQSREGNFMNGALT